MRYTNQREYRVIHKCGRCGKKMAFLSTRRFRVNANKNKLDVWLIYQCEHCKHTLNLAVYERQKVSSVPKAEYEAFLSNDAQLAQQYGKTLSLFQKNKAAVDFEQMNYSYVKLHETTQDSGSDKSMELTIHNPCGLKIRPEKQIADVLGLSRSQVKKRMAQGEILVDETDFGKLHFYSPHCIM